MMTGLSTGAIVGIVLAVIVVMVTIITLAISILLVYCCPGVCKCGKLASRSNEANAAYSDKSGQQVVMTGKYAFKLDYNVDPIEDDLPPI